MPSSILVVSQKGDYPEIYIRLYRD